MNDKDKEAIEFFKDKEAFRLWAGEEEGESLLYEGTAFHTWLAACEYKQKEITLLENEISYLEETISDFMDDPDIAIKRLQSENKKLREALEFYADTDNWLEEKNRNNLYTVIKFDASDDYDDALRFGGKRAREALKKLEGA